MNVSSPFYHLQAETFQGYIGFELINRLDVYASELLAYPIQGVFSRSSRMWKLCAKLFQEWYLGDELYLREYGHAPAQLGKPGCIHFEQPLLGLEPMRMALRALQEQGYTLGIATGRPEKEALLPLKNYGLYSYFDEARVVTYTAVARAEAELREQGKPASLAKPHPYQFLRAADPSYRPGQGQPQRGSFVVVGDSTSDVLGAHAAGALMIAVLTGARTAEARTLLEQSQPDFIVEDMTQVPALLAHIDNLATIQRLQFSQRARAELLLQRWFTLHMHLDTEGVTLTPKPVSLNSFNGFYRAGGEEYFFKTHVEEQGVLEEYYHAELLHQAGYNIVRPLHTLHEQGQQMVVYPVVRLPVMFDLMREIEIGQTKEAMLDVLAAEKNECESLLGIYQATLEPGSAEQHARAPIHQLFWHRLTGGRLKNFYENKFVPFPDGQEVHNAEAGMPFEKLLGYRWTINGDIMGGEQHCLGELIERAKVVLHPAHAAYTAIGNGDAHFGNVFLEDQRRYLYFDPAFAGRHSPLLDIVKPLFHNVFATWMYFSQDVARDLQLLVAVRGKQIVIEHNYKLTPVRQALLRTKIEHLLFPLTALLRERDALPADWRDILRLALMCCPLLTINLLDQQRLPPAVSWLGFSQVIQMATYTLEGE